MQHTASTDAAEVYVARGNPSLRAGLSLAGGVGLVLFSLLGFLLALRTNPDMFTMQFTTTLPMLFAVGLFASAWSAARAPRQVWLDDAGLHVVGARGAMRTFPWDHLSIAKPGTILLGSKQTLTVYGLDGKAQVRLTSDVQDFNAMAASIQRRLAERATPAAQRVERSKSRRTGVLLVAGGVLAWALAGANTWIALSERGAAELLETRGAPAEAVVVRKFVAPDGRTHRIEYRVVTGAGPDAPYENVEVDRALWALLAEGDHIDAIAVPGRPDVSRLRIGQIDDPMNPDPTVMLLLSAAIAAMGAFFAVAGVLAWRGIDITFDSNGGGLRIKRHGADAAEANGPERRP